MNILDELEKIKKIDSKDMLGVEENFYNQLLEAQEIANNTQIESISIENLKGIAFLGMGGSGFTGDIIKSMLEDYFSLPIVVVKGYNLPAFINKNWLIVAVSYSGNTEETLICVEACLKLGCKIICVCSGGTLLEVAKNNNLVHIDIPAGFQPRGAVGYLFFSTFLVLKRLGIASIKDEEIKETIDLIKLNATKYNRQIKTEDNPAKKLALEIYGRLPIIYGVNGYLSTIAYRWKTQINENSKSPCFCAEFPELNHNEIVGWENLSDVSQRFVLIVFQDDDFSEIIKKRINTTINLIQDWFDAVVLVKIEGESKLAKALFAIYLGGITSVYLAFLYQTDPTPVSRIAALKAAIKN